MATKFKHIAKNSYSFDIDMPSSLSTDLHVSPRSLMGYIIFKNDGRVEFSPLHLGNAVSVNQSISILSFVLSNLSKELK